MPILRSIRATFGDRTNRIAEKAFLGGHADQIEAVATQYDHQSDVLEHSRLDEARYWLAAIADSSDDAIVGKDLNGVVTSWNKAAEVMFGYTADEIIGQPITRIIPLNRMEEEASILKRVRRSEKIVHFETKRQCKDGSVIPVSLTVLPIRDDHGRIIGVSKTARDLSESQRIHRDLERREALFRSILETVPDALIVIDKQGFIHSFSAAAERLFGYTSAEMMGQNVCMLLPASDWERHNAAMAGYSGTGGRTIVGFGQRKNSSTFPMQFVVGEVSLPGQRLFTAFVHDLSEQTERERELRTVNAELERLVRHLSTARDVAARANWAKSRFLAGVGHDLRTPLSGMLGYAQLLRMEGGLNAAQSARVNALLAGGKHMLQMITGVLDLAETEIEHVELQAVEFDVLAVATACLDLVRPAAEEKHLSLSIATAPRVPREVVTDPVRLKQLLLNLLGNAVKFTSEGSIELRLRPMSSGSVVRIEVADTGPGISASDRRRLFREFESLDVASARASGGVGLSLVLSARLATLLGGCLGHHDNPGGGSVFWLELPVDNTSETHSVPPAVKGAPAPQASLHVLVVDDVAMNRDIAESFLLAAGHTVIGVEGGTEAVAAVATTNFDVVLMDVRMPEMDGLEATRRIRALDDNRGHVPIIALTAQAFTEQVVECRKAGMNGHVSKPFDPETLVAAVVRAHAEKSAHDQEPASVPAIVRPPVVGSELLVCNPSAFERTAFYLAPETVASCLERIAERGETLLRVLRGPDALICEGDELADAALTIAGSAGMFGYERLTVVGRRFERAIQAGAADAPALAEGLTAALEVTLQDIYDRTLVVVAS